MTCYGEVIGKHLAIDGKWSYFEHENARLFLNPSEPLQDSTYMQLTELKFLLKNLRELSQIQIYHNFSKADTVVAVSSKADFSKRSYLDQAKLQEEIENLDKAVFSLGEYISSRLEACVEKSVPFPRIVVLCQQYHFQPKEADLFHLMVVAQGSNNPAVLNTMLEEDYLRKMSGFKRVSGMADVDVDLFCDADRAHMKENIVAVDEENGIQFNLRIQNVAVQLLYGRKVRGDDLLKISQTSLEAIIYAEQQPDAALTSPMDTSISTTPTSRKRPRDALSEDEEDEADLHTPLHSASKIARGPKLMRSHSWGPGGKSPHVKPILTSPGLHSVPSTNSLLDTDAAAVPSNTHLLIEGESTSSLTAYSASDQLDYLEDCFQWIALMIKGNVVKMKDDLKKEGTTKNTNWGDNMTDIKHSKRELLAKIKLQENRIEKRLQKTVEAGISAPRLEELVKKFNLDIFEKGLILLLIGKTVSPIVRTLLETLDTSQQHMDDVITVGQALSILCQNFHNQIYSRKYFYQNSKLLLNAIVTLTKPRWHNGSGDLTENKVLIDRRILDYIVGLDSEINELVEGSDLYTPNIPLDSVVLPKESKALLLSQCAAYDIYIQYKQHLLSSRHNGGSEEKHVIAYGNSLVILLCGIPGTGKTMTVNALATELKKKVLLCDFNSLINKKDQQSDIEIDLKGLFRESKLNNALLFFDECEHIFKNRNYTSDRIINSMLIEIEKHEGIVFLATNRAHELDEAMHRRITMVLEYSTPDKYMRKIIWDNLLDGMTCKPGQVQPLQPAEDGQSAPNKILLSEDVDTSILASKYQLTGGFIKNAVLSAILMSLSRDKVNPVMMHGDLLTACQMQMRGNLTQKAFESRLPDQHKTMAKLYVSEQQRMVIQKVVHFESTRNTVYGSWSLAKEAAAPAPAPTAASALLVDNPLANAMKAISSASAGNVLTEKACITLLAGLQGSGKYTIVETIANELRIKHIKYIHIGDFVNNNIYEVAEIFKLLIKDASILDASIVINGFEHLLEDSTEGSANKLHLTLSRVMEILYDFRGPVFLLANIDNPQNIVLQREFSSRLFAFLRLTLPAAEQRGKLWKSLLPSAAPLAADIDFTTLGRRYDLYPGDIRSAIAYAAAEVATRTTNKTVTQKDLMAAGEHEIAKCKGDHSDMISKLFA